MSTEFYADYIKKTTFDPETNSVRSKLVEAATDTKKKPPSKTPKEVAVEPTEIPEAKMRKCPVTGKMIPVDEKLHGDQHRLDHNKDEKITSSDMKKVREKGAVKDHPMEAEEKPAPVIIKSKKSTARLRRDAASRPTGVREDDLSEVAPDTMKSYMKYAKKQAVSISQKPNVNKDDMRKFGNRVKGVSMAQKKLGEDQELEEGTFKVDVDGLPTMYIDGSSAGEIKSQLRKKFKDPKAVVSIERITPAEKKKELRAKVAEDQAAVDAFLKKGGTVKKLPAAHARSTSDMEKDVKGRVDTSRFKTKGKVKSMEDVEQVDELSKRTLGGYSRTATRDVAVKTGDAYRAIFNRDKKAEKEADRKRDNRYKGIDLATKKLQQEGMYKDIDTEKSEPKPRSSGEVKLALKVRRGTANPLDKLELARKKADPNYKMNNEGLGDIVSSAVSSVGNTVKSAVAKRQSTFGTSKGAKSASQMREAEEKLTHLATHGHEKVYVGNSSRHDNTYHIHNSKTGEKHEVYIDHGGKPWNKPTIHKDADYQTNKKISSAAKNTIYNDHRDNVGHAESVQERENSLWGNIHAKRDRIKAGSGEKMREPGSKGAPTKADFKRSQ